MGSGITPLVRGYDCSSEATYLPVSFYDSDSDSTTTKNDTICMFEKDLQKPISRHFQYSDSGSTKGVAFELRTINTVGNYDYIISYIFYPEGSIQMENLQVVIFKQHIIVQVAVIMIHALVQRVLDQYMIMSSTSK